MNTTSLPDNSKVNCISRLEAQMLHKHIEEYFNYSVKVKEGNTVVDVGANIGVLGLYLSKKFKDIKILSFEPIKDIFEVLEANSLLSKNNKFKSFNCGVSDQNGSIVFDYYPNIPALSNCNPKVWESNDALILAVKGSLEDAPQYWWWSKMIPSFLYPFIVSRLKRNMKKINCNLKTLATIINENNLKKIDLLKIDCEGNELKVINGIEEKNWAIIEQLIIEVHDVNNRLNYIKKLLIKKKYHLHIMQEPSLKKIGIYNIFAVRNQLDV